MSFIIALWSKAKLYVMAAAGVLMAIGTAFALGRHKGEVAGETKVAAKAAQSALKEALEASKNQQAVSQLKPGAAQAELAKEWARGKSDASL